MWLLGYVVKVRWTLFVGCFRIALGGRGGGVGVVCWEEVGGSEDGRLLVLVGGSECYKGCFGVCVKLLMFFEICCLF